MGLEGVVILSGKQFAAIAIALGCCISLANWIWFFQNLKNKDKDAHPTPPIVGASLLGLGLAYFDITRPFAILSIVVDHGTLVLIIASPYLIKEFWQTSRFKLIKSFVANSDNAKYELKLYKKGTFVITVNFEPTQIANEHGAKIIEFSLQGKWEEYDDVIECSKYADDRILRLVLKGDSWLAKEYNYPQEKLYPYDCLEGIEFATVSTCR